MRTLVLATALTAMASGCIITSSDDTGAFCGDGIVDPGEQCDDGNNVSGDGCSATCASEAAGAYITANWTIKSVATNSTATCPPGFDTTALYSQPVDANGSPTGSVIIDLFDCAANTGTSDPLPPGLYQSWIEIANHDNTSQYAKSLSAYVDVTSQDQTFNAQILTDGGYFQFAWSLVGETSGSPLTCTQAGASGGVEAIATDVSNSSNSASDVFTCEDGAGVTAGYLAATYTVSVDALNSSMQAVGTAPAITNKVIQGPNLVTDLGTVSIPITGL